MKDFMRDVFGTIGWKSIQVPIFASIISGENLILYGETGANKTGFVENFAKVLNLSYRIYTVPTIELEEITPFKKDENETVVPIKTLTSIWDAELVFLDELNRISPEKQGVFFEVLRGKSIKGIPLKDLKWVMSAVNLNTEEYVGTKAFDPATADRFAFVVGIPSFSGFGEEDAFTVGTIKNEFENKPLGYFLNEVYKPSITIQEIKESDKEMFRDFLKKSSLTYYTIYNNNKQVESLFIQSLVDVIQKIREQRIGKVLETDQIGGRKFNTYKKTLLSGFAIWKELNYNYNNKNFLRFSEFKDAFFDLLNWSNTQTLIGNKDFSELLKSGGLYAFENNFKNLIYTEVKTPTDVIIELFEKPEDVSIIKPEEIKSWVLGKINDKNETPIDYKTMQMLNLLYCHDQTGTKQIVDSLFDKNMDVIGEYGEGKLVSLLELNLNSDTIEKLALLNYYYYLNDSVSQDNSYNYKFLKTYENYRKYFNSKISYIKKGLVIHA